MPQRKKQLWVIWDQETKEHISKIILNELNQYAIDRQFYPSQGALYTYMTKGEFDKKLRKHIPGRYPDLSIGKFNHWYDRLVEEGYIEVDITTRAIRCLYLVIVEKETDSPLG